MTARLEVGDPVTGELRVLGYAGLVMSSPRHMIPLTDVPVVERTDGVGEIRYEGVESLSVVSWPCPSS